MAHRRKLIVVEWRNEWAKGNKPISTHSFSWFPKRHRKPPSTPTDLPPHSWKPSGLREVSAFILGWEMLKTMLVNPSPPDCLPQPLSCFSAWVCLVRNIFLLGRGETPQSGTLQLICSRFWIYLWQNVSVGTKFLDALPRKKFPCTIILYRFLTRGMAWPPWRESRCSRLEIKRA